MKVLRVLDSMWTALKEHLFKDTPKEGAAVLLCQKSRSSRGVTLLGQALVFPEADDLEVQEVAGVGYKKEFQRKLLALCKGERLHLVTCHSHPFSERGVRFSSIDDRWDRQFCFYTSRRLPWMMHGSLVMGRSDCDARLFEQTTESLVSFDRICLVGNALSLLWPTSASRIEDSVPDSRYNRQEILLGSAGQTMLQGLTVAIAGLSGTGSHVAQQLAYLGVGNFILSDTDHVEPTNLNRLVGAKPCHARLNLPKVQVASRMIRSISPQASVTALRQSVVQSADFLKQADVIFSCVDAEVPRLFLARFPAQYYIPVIDVGTGMKADDGRVAELFGQVRMILPHGPCFVCMGSLNYESIRREMLSEQEKEQQRQHGYGLGAEVPAPAVISLNGTVASLAVSEFINLIGQFREPCCYLFYDGMSPHRTAYEIRMDKVEDCLTCGLDTMGLGDSRPISDFLPKPAQLPQRRV